MARRSGSVVRIINHTQGTILVEPPLPSVPEGQEGRLPAAPRRAKDVIRLLPYQLSSKDDPKVNEVDKGRWEEIMKSYPQPGTGTEDGKPTLGPPPVLAAYLARGKDGGISFS